MQTVTQMTLEELNAHKAYLSNKMQDTLASNDPDLERLALEIQKDFDAINEQIKLKELKV